MKFRLIVLPVLLAGLLASVHLLPEAGEMADSAVEMKLPEAIGPWKLRHQPASQVEIATLAPDTLFSKAVCLRDREGEYEISTGIAIPDRLDLSVVLSGHDLNNSIHRPERCMPSQGHEITESKDMDLALSDGKALAVKRLLSIQSIPVNEKRTEFSKLQCVTYYFFVGHNNITQSHFQRTLLDMKDRLVVGMDQRWAYVSVSMWYGKVPWIREEVAVEEADRKLKDFLIEFGNQQINWEMIRM